MCVLRGSLAAGFVPVASAIWAVARVDLIASVAPVSLDTIALWRIAIRERACAAEVGAAAVRHLLLAAAFNRSAYSGSCRADARATEPSSREISDEQIETGLR